MIWSSNLAYVIGLLVTDGSLSKDGRHIVFVSKDKTQVENVVKILDLKNRIAKKSSGQVSNQKLYYYVQFGNINFYQFLIKIGLTPNKSKTIGTIVLPSKYFADFLRGHFDGDGYSYSYFDKRWKNSFCFYICFTSASIDHIHWLNEQIKQQFQLVGHVTPQKTVYRLAFSKKQALKLAKTMYREKGCVCLKRKYSKILNVLKYNTAV